MTMKIVAAAAGAIAFQALGGLFASPARAAWGWFMDVPTGCEDSNFTCTVVPDAGMSCDVTSTNVVCSIQGGAQNFVPDSASPMCAQVNTSDHYNNASLSWSTVPTCGTTTSTTTDASTSDASMEVVNIVHDEMRFMDYVRVIKNEISMEDFQKKALQLGAIISQSPSACKAFLGAEKSVRPLQRHKLRRKVEAKDTRLMLALGPLEFYSIFAEEMASRSADTTAADGLLMALDQGGLWREALASIAARQRRGPRPGLHAFGAAMGACSRGLEWQQGLLLLRKMVQLKLRPDLWIWSAATSACEKGHAWHLALHFLRDMSRRGLKSDAVVYNASISACEKGMQWRRAIALFSEMSLRSVRPNVVTYNSTVSACEKNFRWVEALQLVDQLERSKEGEEDSHDSAAAKESMFFSFSAVESVNEASCLYARNPSLEQKSADSAYSQGKLG
ncbi:Pentatricopeptide repeat-containing protein, chloroplastic [Symbiodinium microadriaticum]|uniref:Pentatricopeptide repeat-containing protein, chloroplastic n=1 Tax=Symbiodinium microadriaticum TaxID=2951 RepID=A0A1Q9CJX7_SYMMI|nr:Pentatricopeptide repeat-containing protein, chloroplastic [Symbiodinium microadriaticum]